MRRLLLSEVQRNRIQLIKFCFLALSLYWSFMLAGIHALSCSMGVKSSSIEKQLIPNLSDNLSFFSMRQWFSYQHKISTG